MAHQVNVTPVKASLQPTDPDEKVRDPVCGMEISRRESRYVVFREMGSYYFCSKICQQEFMSPTFKAGKSRARKAA
ncbi:MAG: hypothetical protein NDJ89_05335 [Oligoflexia bacterium]|nr:hypothetical protein [Oligoflexia bacterium]